MQASSLSALNFPCIIALGLSKRDYLLMDYWLQGRISYLNSLEDRTNHTKSSTLIQVEWHKDLEDSFKMSKIISSHNRIHFFSYSKEQEELCYLQIEELRSLHVPMFFIQNISQQKQEIEIETKKNWNLLHKGIVAFWPFYEIDLKPIYLPYLAIPSQDSQVFLFSKNKELASLLRQMLLFSGTSLRTDLRAPQEIYFAIEQLLERRESKNSSESIVFILDLNSLTRYDESIWLSLLKDLKTKIRCDIAWEKRVHVFYLQDMSSSSISLDFMHKLVSYFSSRIFHPYEFLLLLSYLFCENFKIIKNNSISFSSPTSTQDKWRNLNELPLDCLKKIYLSIAAGSFSSNLFPFIWLWNLFSTKFNQITGLFLKSNS